MDVSTSGLSKRGQLASALKEGRSNWRLVLLGMTGLILSLASGWTTWDGMSNFTCPNGNTEGCGGPRILSFMITFGIQGIMLIAAWLIGETFAANHSSQRSYRSGWFSGGILVFATLIGFGLVALVLQPDRIGTIAASGFDYQSFSFDRSAMAWASLLVGAIALFLILGRREIAGPYLSGAMVVLRNLPLWIMFLSCMATSVFFSFDSLFSTIFPQKDRERAAKLRVENKVQGVLADVQQSLAVKRLRQTNALFASNEWSAFDTNLSRLVTAAEDAPDAVKKRRLEQVAQTNSQKAEIEGRIKTAEQKESALKLERATIEEELKGLDARRAPAQARITTLDDELAAKRGEIVTAQTAAEGELRGVRGTGNAGAGPEYRRLRSQVQNLELDATEIERRLTAARQRVAGINDEAAKKRTRLAEIARAMIEAERAKGNAQQQFSIFEQTGANFTVGNLDAEGGIKALEAARKQFRREPTLQGLETVQRYCTSLFATLKGVNALSGAASQIDCSSGDASVVANRIFRLRDAEANFRSTCTAGEKLPRGDANKLLAFSSVCIQNSGLTGDETATFRTELNRIALNRDDQAHRFVVTWNAFNDGNSLAYLALAIALAIDGLVFMSGLFGANVIRSPLSFLREEEIERKIDNALGEDKYNAISMVVKHIENFDGPIVGSFFHQIDRHAVDKHDELKRIVAAGQDMGVVRYLADDEEHDPETPESGFEGASESNAAVSSGRFALHAEFNQQLQQAFSRHQSKFVGDNSHDPKRTVEQIRKEVHPMLIHALQPDPKKFSRHFLELIEPDSSHVGFMGTVQKPEEPSFYELARDRLRSDDNKKIQTVDHLRRVLNVGTAQKLVDSNAGRGVYRIRPLFFSILNDIHADFSRMPDVPPAAVVERPVAQIDTNAESVVSAPAVRDAVARPELQVSAPPLTDPATQSLEPEPAQTTRTDRATVPIDVQQRNVSMQDFVIEKFFSVWQAEPVARKRATGAMSTAPNTLEAIAKLDTGLSDRIVNRIRDEASAYSARVVAELDPEIKGNRLAMDELNHLSIAAAGQGLLRDLSRKADQLLRGIDEAQHIAMDDKMVRRATQFDQEFEEATPTLEAMTIQDSFNRDLVNQIAVAAKVDQWLAQVVIDTPVTEAIRSDAAE
ncbi:MAG: hypothetical protein AAFZ01_04590 [Pseudomonadota bacterium]